jgi:hypothetical protein
MIEPLRILEDNRRRAVSEPEASLPLSADAGVTATLPLRIVAGSKHKSRLAAQGPARRPVFRET